MDAIPQFHHPSLVGKMNLPGTSDFPKSDYLIGSSPKETVAGTSKSRQSRPDNQSLKCDLTSEVIAVFLI